MTAVGRQVLRTLAVLVTLQVLTSFVGAWLLGRMTPAVDRILVDNERSLEAVETMALALTADDLDARARFESSLAVAENNVTEHDERPELRVLRENYPRALTGDLAARAAVRDALARLGAVNRVAMERANEEAQRLGLAGAWVVALFGILGLIGSVLAVVRTRRRLVGPLRVLADVVTDHARGSSHRRCPRTEGGELGEVLGHVNELLDRIERAKPTGPDVDARIEALHHFLDTRPSPTFVVEADGTVKAASASGFDAIAEDAELRARLAAAAREGTLEGATVTKLGDAALVELG
ncbi:MAG: hypothetical protein H6721_04600 [Sandaracinus sp.]|nr:hypothetical protein [Myxococcales bacterium]MCB9631406.1 hypothetical protein [Sandaracinus sp.]